MLRELKNKQKRQKEKHYFGDEDLAFHETFCVSSYIFNLYINKKINIENLTSKLSVHKLPMLLLSTYSNCKKQKEKKMNKETQQSELHMEEQHDQSQPRRRRLNLSFFQLLSQSTGNPHPHLDI